MKKNKLFLFGLLLTTSLLWPFFYSTYFTHHDDVQVIRLFEMDKCIKDLQIPCRWVPDLGGLYGYPIFNYYAPLPYYIGEFFYLLTGSLIISAKLMFIVPFIGAYIFMYLLGKKLWGDWGGLISATFYSFAPYHAVVLYVRGAMGELWALMFFPAIFWAMFCLKDRMELINALRLGLLFALLILSHNLSAMIFIPLTVIFLGFIFFIINRKLKFVVLIIFAFAISLLIASFYLLPMVFEKNLVHVESMVGGYFSYTEHFKGINKLFVERMWGWGASVREIPGGERDGMSFQIGWVHLFAWFAALITTLWLISKKDYRSGIIIFASLIILLSIFLIHPRSEPIWKLIEPLKYLQFPWRFLMLVIFFISLISGAIISLLTSQRRKFVSFVLIALVVATNFSYFRPERFIQTDDKQILEGDNWDKLIKRSIFDFLPVYAELPPAELATVRYEIIQGDVVINDFKEGSNWIYFKADAKNDVKIRLSQYYFPGWKILVNNRPVSIDYNNQLGLMTFSINKGSYEIRAKLENSPVRVIANLLTILGLIVMIVIYYKSRLR
ncbi:hypothetical protein C4577_07675 [Candidatus Parcubacteria bacterium]|nr:MAG: hypothetical protein C4577_07675 [Candidatus Parcubacteria bacterium]